MADKPTTVDEYISTFPEDLQVILQQIRETIQRTIPDATEKISYGIPTFVRNDTYVMYFSGWKHHVALYPIPHDNELQAELEPYMEGKGTLKFPLDEPIPYDLIEKVAKLLDAENTGRSDS
jgi:uncharacterized protein YdhG (YjbR/CyaY superfamily)